jgi:3',5'-cyclic AMP phosphodiesterase CpdA
VADIILQLSDSHLMASDATASEALAAVVARVLALEPRPAALLLTGDLTQNGEPESYARVREIVQRLAMPVYPIPGNHDDRAEFRAAFADHPQVDATTAYVNYAVVIGETRVLMCDTLLSGEEAGALASETLAWLERELSRERDRPTLIAMHHPPIRTGIASIDAIGLPDEHVAALQALLAKAPNVGAIVCGHVHRAIVGSLGAVRVCVCPSTLVQLELDLGQPRPFRLADEPPGFAVHVNDAGTVTSHFKALGGYGASAGEQ